VRDFFFDNSIGRCTYTNVVAPYYRAQHPKSHYTNESIEMPRRAWELILEALAHHKANGFDFSRLTTDAQGFVYALNVYCAGRVSRTATRAAAMPACPTTAWRSGTSTKPATTAANR
jgi:M6 family metalloprotease-like protein